MHSIRRPPPFFMRPPVVTLNPEAAAPDTHADSDDSEASAGAAAKPSGRKGGKGGGGRGGKKATKATEQVARSHAQPVFQIPFTP